METYTHRSMSVENDRVVVIGGTSGIGEAIAYGFATEGADVIATSRRESAVDQTASELETLGATTARVTCDVTDEESLQALCAATTETLGGIDTVILSQGAIAREPLLEIDEESFDRVIDVALTGVQRVIQTFGPEIADGGTIIPISSLTARLSMAELPAYTAAKGGVEALTRAASKELAPSVRVNAIAPGFVITPQNEATYAEGTEKRSRIDERTPLGRVGDREEIVGSAIFLSSDGAAYITGEVLTIDGGFATSAF